MAATYFGGGYVIGIDQMAYEKGLAKRHRRRPPESFYAFMGGDGLPINRRLEL